MLMLLNKYRHYATSSQMPAAALLEVLNISRSEIRLAGSTRAKQGSEFFGRVSESRGAVLRRDSPGCSRNNRGDQSRVKYNLRAVDSLKEVQMAATKRTRLVIAGLVSVGLGLSAALFVLRLIPREVSREQFLIEVRQRHLKKATIYPQDHIAVADYGNPGAIRTVLTGYDQTFAKELRALGVEVTFGTSDSVGP